MSEETVDRMIELAGSVNKLDVLNILADVLLQLAKVEENNVRWRLVILPGSSPKKPNLTKELLHCSQCDRDFEVFVERDHDPDVCPVCGSVDWDLPF
ncbi:MAG: hypothetical protein JXR84_04310 [Anaerolineae bacterium]|nr:hypothetical protein [Anaerolineae bacterium]